jgi:hypothetical protein
MLPWSVWEAVFGDFQMILDLDRGGLVVVIGAVWTSCST